MYFVVIIVFALLLADGLPPREFNLFPLGRFNPADSTHAINLTLALVVAQVFLTAAYAGIANRYIIRANDGTHEGLDRTHERHSRAGLGLLILLTVTTLFLMICTPWLPLVRTVWRLDRWPLASELVILAPFFASLTAAWLALYPADRVIRRAAIEQRVLDGAAPRPVWSRGVYLAYKFRHQIAIIAVPMLVVLFAKHYIDTVRYDVNRATRIPYAADLLVGAVVSIVLFIAPLFIRYIWATRRLENGDLRDRLERQCDRVGLKYREILVWDSHGLIVNAAVMGFVAPIRFVLLSDGLIETMSPRQIEAVFGHEAGHVRHHHLQFFVVFSVLSMLVVGGILELLNRYTAIGTGMLQLVAMIATLVVWGAGFGWVSRCFERQADIFGVRAITADIDICSPDCLIHANPNASQALFAPGLCLAAAHVFGTTLQRIAELNGIPREAPSWRHGSIGSRCVLVHNLADHPQQLNRFDRKVTQLKAGLVILTAIGLAIACWLYWPSALFRQSKPRAVPLSLEGRRPG